MLIGAAVALYPRLLPSSGVSGVDITISKSLAGLMRYASVCWGGLSGCAWQLFTLSSCIACFASRSRSRAVNMEIDKSKLWRTRVCRTPRPVLHGCVRNSPQESPQYSLGRNCYGNERASSQGSSQYGGRSSRVTVWAVCVKGMPGYLIGLNSSEGEKPLRVSARGAVFSACS
jgi:hypothetical protein